MKIHFGYIGSYVTNFYGQGEKINVDHVKILLTPHVFIQFMCAMILIDFDCARQILMNVESYYYHYLHFPHMYFVSYVHYKCAVP